MGSRTLKEVIMFIDEMYEQLLVDERSTYGMAHKEVYLAQKPQTYADLKRIENGYQLFRKRHPEADEDSFRRFVKSVSLEDYERMQKLYGWNV